MSTNHNKVPASHGQNPGKPSLHDPDFVAGLFDRMASTYGVLNYITSFGFSERWRKQCVHAVSAEPGPESLVVYDLMSGMGEAWPSLLGLPLHKLKAVDLSEGMCIKAREHARRYAASIEVLQSDALGDSIPSGQADLVISCFGLKTLSQGQRDVLARKVFDYLKPGGKFSFVEISSARGWWLGGLYRFYLKRIIPVLGRLFGGDTGAYGMLGVYTVSFGNCKDFAEALRKHGLEANFGELFFGCASLVSGRKPASSS
ncbi:MAG TPA: ubiquinone biosynthesis methyltransferase UbiE [Leptospiraceae bacterium]|nr:ubiquinone biosynthesis methyltransferase UbiE [Spirochaetaceae bacterium]HBS06391.1 ubiquinone biosynthesis methyltransferase UbiE [Leptospiraceae bacterium]|tara:strand:+ start:16200 stop:16973 length:774 start_codon:yes stop_codon:yes gene_type:complete